MPKQRVINPRHIELWTTRDEIQKDQNAYLQDFESKVDSHLASDLGSEMRAHLESIKAEIQTSPNTFIGKKISKLNQLINQTPVEVDIETE